LAQIIDEHNQKLIETFLGSADPSGTHRFWIGLTDLFHEGTFMWEPSRTAPTYLNWRGGQPDNVGNREHFVHIDSKIQHGRTWNDCSNETCPNDPFALCELNI